MWFPSIDTCSEKEPHAAFFGGPLQPYVDDGRFPEWDQSEVESTFQL
jgi:hypothetical protein